MDRWEIATFAAFDEFIDKSHSYVDIGGWIGPTVLYGAQLAKECFAAEPDPVAFEILNKNVELNDAIRKKVRLFNGCISDLSGVEHLGTQSTFGDSMSSLLFSGNKGSLEVPALTLEDYFTKFNIRECNFIKIDVEGGEIKILPQAKEFLRSFRPTLLLALHSNLFQNKDEFAEEIIEALKIYKNLYTVYGVKLPFKELEEDLKTVGRISEIIAMDTDWKAYRRKRYQSALFVLRVKNRIRRILGGN